MAALKMLIKNIKCIAITTLLFASRVAYSDEVTDYFANDMAVAVTPTRLEQPIDDVPAAITILTHERLKELGVRSVPEALRLVPGFIVGQASGNEYRLEYLGTNGQLPRRMQVLIDGISVYSSEAARVYWERIPVAFDDIDHIEINRGPNSSAYGSNSFLAVVNIITKHPADSVGNTAAVLWGDLGTKDILLRHSGVSGDTQYRMTYDRQKDDGFDLNETLIEDKHDSINIQRLNWRSVTDISPNETVDIRLGISETDWQDEYEEPNQLTFPDAVWQDYHAAITWKNGLSDNHEIQLKAYGIGTEREMNWDTCYPTLTILPELRAMYLANPAYAFALSAGQVPTGGSAEDDALANTVLNRIASLGGFNASLSPTCFNINQDFKRAHYDIELQDTYVFSRSLRLLSGIAIKYDNVESETYFRSGKQSRNSSRAFANVEYIPNKKFTINIGGLFEREDDVLDGTEFSPRLGFNYKVNSHQTLKYVYTTALRSPDFITANRDWNYQLRGLNPLLDGNDEGFFFIRNNANAVGDDLLRPERIEANELIYYINSYSSNIEAEFKYARYRISDAISEDFSFFILDYTNNPGFRIELFEAQLSFRPSKKLHSSLTFAYIDNDTELFTERSIGADKSGSVTTSYQFTKKFQLGFAHYAHLASSDAFFNYRRTDITAHYNALLKKKHLLNLSLILRNQPKGQGAFIPEVGRLTRQVYKDSTHVFLKAEINF